MTLGHGRWQLHFIFASWLPVRVCQQGTLKGKRKAGGSYKGLFLMACCFLTTAVAPYLLLSKRPEPASFPFRGIGTTGQDSTKPASSRASCKLLRIQQHREIPSPQRIRAQFLQIPHTLGSDNPTSSLYFSALDEAAA